MADNDLGTAIATVIGCISKSIYFDENLQVNQGDDMSYYKQVSKKTSPLLSSNPITRNITPTKSYAPLSTVVQRTQQDPKSLSSDELQQLESVIGTRATREIMAGKQTPWVPEFQGISAQLER